MSKNNKSNSNTSSPSMSSPSSTFIKSELVRTPPRSSPHRQQHQKHHQFTSSSSSNANNAVVVNNNGKNRRQCHSAGSSTILDSRPDPPPQFDSSDLGSPKKVWSLLCEKDEKYTRDPLLFQRQRKISARMRAMLLDWIMDVCADKELHRETFHLTVDYLDRYLGLLRDEQVVPQRLQLIGATALMIASKIEEIYPPRVVDFAEYTDGCCTEQDLRDMEEVMLLRLEWNCYPVTAVHWLALYMQLMNTDDVIRAHQVTITAPSKCTLGSPFWGSPRPAPLNVSIVLDEEEEEDMEQDVDLKLEMCGSGEEDSENHPSPDKQPRASPKVHTHKRVLSFNSSYPRMQLSQIGSSPKVLIHTAACDLSYVGHRTYSSGHIYPDQRCTVPKLMRGEFVRMAMILDFVTLDADSMQFRYRELATAVLLCSYEPEALIYQITGLTADKIRPARAFVDPFVRHFDRLEPTGTQIPCLPKVRHDDRHNIQTYMANCLDHLASLDELRKQMEQRRKQLEQRTAATAQAQTRKRKFGSSSAMNPLVGLSHEV